MLVTIHNVNHGVLTQHEAGFNFPQYLAKAEQLDFHFSAAKNRKATGGDLKTFGFKGAEFKLLDWEKNDNGKWFYQPHVIRDYYYLNWFDFYLKGKKIS